MELYAPRTEVTGEDAVTEFLEALLVLTVDFTRGSPSAVNRCDENREKGREIAVLEPPLWIEATQGATRSFIGSRTGLSATRGNSEWVVD